MIGTPPRSLAHAFAAQAARKPDGDALIFFSGTGDDQRLSFGQVHADACRGAHALLEAGLREGDLAIIAGQHNYATCQAYLAALYAGVIPSMFRYPASGTPSAAWIEQLRQRVDGARAKGVIATDPSVQSSCETSGFAVDVHTLPSGDRAEGRIGDLPPSSRGGEDIAQVQFSSGTTGDPRGVALSHRAVLENATQMQQAAYCNEQDVFVGWAPLFHDLGLMTGMILPLLFGATSVLLTPTQWARRPSLLLHAIDRYRGTVNWMPNFGFAHTVRAARMGQIEGLDLSSMRMLGCGGEMVRPASLDVFANYLAPLGLDPTAMVVGYGMAEVVVCVTHTPFEEVVGSDTISARAATETRGAVPVDAQDADAVSIASCGHPLPGTTITILSESGEELPDRQIGEIAADTPALFSGYWDAELQDAGPGPLTPYRTGDLGYRVDGELFVCERLKDVIIVGGQNYYPDHIEPIALETAGGRAGHAVAFGLADADLGTEIAVVLCEIKGALTDFERASIASTIHHRVQSDLGLALADVRIVRRGSLPKTTSGKFSRSLARTLYESNGWTPRRAVAVAEAWRDAEGADLVDALGDLAEELFGHRPDPSTSLIDQGVTSLQLVELLTVALDDETNVEPFFAHPSIETLAALRTGSPLHSLSPASTPPRDIRQRRPERREPQDGATAPGRRKLPPARQLKRNLRRSRRAGRRLVRRTRRKLLRRWRGFVRAAAPSGIVRSVATRSPAAAVALAGLLGSHRVFANEWRVVRESYDLISPDETFEEVWESSVRTNLYRLKAFDHLFDDSVDDEVVVVGASTLREARDGHHGLIIVTLHSARFGGLLQAITDLGWRDSASFVGRARILTGWTEKQKRAGRNDGSWNRETLTVTTHQLYDARRALDEGKVVVIAGDGRLGRAGTTCAFLGRERWFGLGFAELAARTGAAIVPVIETVEAGGKRTVKIGSPLAAPGDRVAPARLLDGYVQVLEKQWTEQLGTITWNQLRLFLEDPAAER